MNQIPYFAQIIMQNLATYPIKLRAIALGNPTLGNYAAMSDGTITKFLRQHEDILGIPRDVFSAFTAADVKCGFNRVIDEASYPLHGETIIPGDPEGESFYSSKRSEVAQNVSSCTQLAQPVTVGQINESIYGPCFGPCATWTTAANYLSFRNPWWVAHVISIILNQAVLLLGASGTY